MSHVDHVISSRPVVNTGPGPNESSYKEKNQLCLFHLPFSDRNQIIVVA